MSKVANSNKQRVIVNSDTVVYLDKTNPYINNDTEPLLNPTEINIPDDLINKAIKIDNMTCMIRVICMSDIILSFYYYYINIFFGIFTSLASFNGYLSTIYYKRNLLFCYLIYQYLQTTGRLLNIIYFSVTLYDRNETIYSKNNDSNSTSALIIIKDPLTEILVLSFLFICQIIISFYVTQYYLLLPSKQERNRIEHTLRI